MGTIQIPKSNPRCRESIPVTNWRILGETNSGIQVVIARFNRFEIRDLTIDYFHTINRNRYIVERNFYYLNTAAACGICKGAGKVDWIQKARPEGTPVIEVKKNYWRNRDVIHPYQTHGFQVKRLFGSEPNLYQGEEICGRCKGTGLESMKTVNRSYYGGY
jgi:hypothetical protein